MVSDAGIGALTTYRVSPQGTLSEISQVPDGQLAPCWVALNGNGTEAFAAKAHSGTVSAYAVAADGALTLRSPAVAARPGVGDTDIAVGGHDSLLCISDHPDLDSSAISASGSLGPAAPAVTGLATGTFGLAAANTTTYGYGSERLLQRASVQGGGCCHVR